MPQTGYTLQDILGYVSLLKTVEEVRTGIPDVLPKEFESTTEDVLGDSGRYVSTLGTRQTAKVVEYGAPALDRKLMDIGDRPVKLLHSYEQINLKPLVLQQLRNYENYDVQRMGMQEVGRQTKQFVYKFTNLRRAVIAMVLANGIFYIDKNGNLLPSSTGAAKTISSGMNATTNQGTCQDARGNNIFGASGNALNGGGAWHLQTTNIPLQLRTLKQTAAVRTGYPLEIAIYGKNIPDYLTQNDYVENYLARNQRMRDYYDETGELPAGLLGFRWVKAYESFYDDDSGTHQIIWPDNQITFCPAVNSDWWRVFQGSYMVPTSINIVNDAEAAISNMRQIWGMAAYAQVINNPVTIAMWHLDTFLPVICIPDTVYQVDVES